MPVHPEVLEWCAILAPAIVAGLLLAARARAIQGWCVKVIGSSAVSLVSIGLTLMRLTARCVPETVACSGTQSDVVRLPGLLRTCQHCTEPAWEAFWRRANELELQAQAIVAALCLGVSLLITAHFILWCKRHIFSN